jgi:hypothetical protein
MAAAQRRLGQRAGTERTVELHQYEKAGPDLTRLVSEVPVWERPPAASVRPTGDTLS